MFKSKINLFGQNWIDTVFEERNKQYGAYEMREKESRVTVRALIIGAIIFCLVVTLPLIVMQINETISSRRPPSDTVTMVDLTPPPDVPREDLPPPPPPKEVKTLQDVRKFTPPVVAPAEEVFEELVTQDELKDKKAGVKDQVGDAEGDITLDDRPQDKAPPAIIEDKTIYDKTTVQVEAQYPGGMQKFREYIIAGLEGHSFDASTSEVKMQFRFVIEKDGRLTDIQIISDGGFPEAAAIAVRVLGSCPRWTPAKIDGRPVRLLFTIPIIYKLL